MAAKYGIKEFDYGSIRIFGSKNNYIRIKEQGENFTNICLNEKDKECFILYHTSSNSITKKDLDNKTLHIIYKNKLEDRNIYELSKTGDIIIDKGKIKLYDHNKLK